MDALGLPDPADYTAPTNAPYVSEPVVAPAAVSDEASGVTASVAVPPDAATTGPFPIDPPTVAGDLLTESVNQGGVSP